MMQLSSCAECATAQCNTLARHFVEPSVFSSAAIFNEETIEASVGCFSDSAADANICCDAGNDKILHSFILQEKLKIGVCKCPTPGLVDDWFARNGIEL